MKKKKNPVQVRNNNSLRALCPFRFPRGGPAGEGFVYERTLGTMVRERIELGGEAFWQHCEDRSALELCFRGAESWLAVLGHRTGVL